MRGYYAGLKTCMAGLVLVTDMSVSAFLSGGNMVELMCNVGGYRSVDDMLRDSEGRGLSPKVIGDISSTLKNCKCKLTHLNHWKKLKSFGPPANSPESAFDFDGRKITVADYFVELAITKAQYKAALAPNGGRLLYPSLPTVNFGTPSKPVLVPAELVMVPCGQSRTNRVTGRMTADMVRHAAVRPHEREVFISNDESVVGVVRRDPTAGAFGINGLTREPMACLATLLPPAKIRYASGNDVNPYLSGSWNMDQSRFARTPPAPTDNGYMYGIMIVGSKTPRDMESLVSRFAEDIERDARTAGLLMRAGGAPMLSSENVNEMQVKFGRMHAGGARIVLVILIEDYYCAVKLVSDRMGLATQCIKWKNVEKPPRGFHQNVMLKVNTKMGGTNHTLAPRVSGGVRPSEETFQDPPQSLSWLFDKPCMLMGIDVSHAEPGKDRESMAAVVASMDGRACQYAAHISAQAPRVEIVSALEEAVRKLLDCFRSRNNGKLPASIIVYRDGVGDGQFEDVINRELPPIKTAIALLGYHEEDVKIAIVICQKGHHTRLVYEEAGQPGQAPSYINPCPGLVVDANGEETSIASGRYNEFYLNSHIAIQGTSKPCKYALVYDEIGFKMAELELLTYWSCYLYCRCNKSVSLATPAYYAHWASKRAKNIYNGGGSALDLQLISDKWTSSGMMSTMYFV